MTTIEYWSHIGQIKMERVAPIDRHASAEALSFKFGAYVVASKKKKGSGKGYKETLKWEWTDYAGYRKALKELFPREYGLMRIKEMHQESLEDRWWDTDNYRAEHRRWYRAEITALRKQYGLTSSEVKAYMEVY